MSDRTIEVKLIDAPDLPGTLRLASFAPLAAALQSVVSRLGRALDDRAGPGATPAALERLTRLTLVGVHEGSTALEIHRGDLSALDVETAEDRLIDERLFELIEHIRLGTRPEWTTPPLALSVESLVDALAKAAPRASFSTAGRGTVEMATARLEKSVWQAAALERSSEVSVVGRLEAVDIDSGTFRLRDDVGNRITLKRVEDPEAAAQHIGQRVQGTGTAVRDDQGLIKRVVDVVVVTAALPAAWLLPRQTDLAAVVEAVDGPDPDGGVELTDDEFTAFLRAARG